jgi:hypothetical protein
MTTAFKFNNQRFYTINGNVLPSVTTVLRDGKDTYGINKWKSSMSATEYEAYMSRSINRGNKLHGDVERFFKGEEIIKDEPITKLLPILQGITPVLVEGFLHTDLYAGVADLVGEYKGKLTLFDWKTSNKSKKTKTGKGFSKLGDYNLQLSAYWHALCLAGYKVEQCMIIALVDGIDEPEIFEFSEDKIKGFYEKFNTKLHSYWSQSMPNISSQLLLV